MLPQPRRVFRALEECPYDSLSVVIIGQDPYPSLDDMGCSYANGIAFSVDDGSMTPSLRVIREWLESCYPQTCGLAMDTTLLSWCKQGVLLINASLTIERTKSVKPISHRKVWEATIRSLLSFCGTKGGIVFVMMGSVAADYDDSIPHGNVKIVIEHPASVARRVKKGARNDIFLRINDSLLGCGKAPISWTSVFHQ